jgi:hypothetical protein
MLVCINDGSDHGLWITWITEKCNTSFDGFLECLDEGWRKRLFDVYTSAGSTNLATDRNEPKQTVLDCYPQVCIWEDDDGVLAAQFESNTLQSFGRRNVDFGSRPHAARERNLQVKKPHLGDTLLMSGWAERRAPVRPAPLTTFNTPGGNPASLKSLAQ